MTSSQQSFLSGVDGGVSVSVSVGVGAVGRCKSPFIKAHGEQTHVSGEAVCLSVCLWDVKSEGRFCFSNQSFPRLIPVYGGRKKRERERERERESVMCDTERRKKKVRGRW